MVVSPWWGAVSLYVLMLVTGSQGWKSSDYRCTTPPLVLQYGESSIVKCGNEMSQQEVGRLPSIVQHRWASELNLYTLLLVDPDMPEPGNPDMAEYLHYLAVNVPGRELRKGFALGNYNSTVLQQKYNITTLAEYEPPTPRAGIHRLFWFIFRQNPPCEMPRTICALRREHVRKVREKALADLKRARALRKLKAALLLNAERVADKQVARDLPYQIQEKERMLGRKLTPMEKSRLAQKLKRSYVRNMMSKSTSKAQSEYNKMQAKRRAIAAAKEARAKRLAPFKERVVKSLRAKAEKAVSHLSGGAKQLAIAQFMKHWAGDVERQAEALSKQPPKKQKAKKKKPQQKAKSRTNVATDFAAQMAKAKALEQRVKADAKKALAQKKSRAAAKAKAAKQKAQRKVKAVAKAVKSSVKRVFRAPKQAVRRVFSAPKRLLKRTFRAPKQAVRKVFRAPKKVFKRVFKAPTRVFKKISPKKAFKKIGRWGRKKKKPKKPKQEKKRKISPKKAFKKISPKKALRKIGRWGRKKKKKRRKPTRRKSRGRSRKRRRRRRRWFLFAEVQSAARSTRRSKKTRRRRRSARRSRKARKGNCCQDNKQEPPTCCSHPCAAEQQEDYKLAGKARCMQRATVPLITPEKRVNFDKDAFCDKYGFVPAWEGANFFIISAAFGSMMADAATG